ncbi:EAL domain-containing protein [Photobacterium kagoshimensis]
MLTEKHFDFIKVDKSIIGMCEQDTVAYETLKFILKLSKSINAGLVIEGVETAQHLAFVPENPNVFIQGFLLSKPIKLTSTLSMIPKE